VIPTGFEKDNSNKLHPVFELKRRTGAIYIFAICPLSTDKE
jgi:hypothetical protein